MSNSPPKPSSGSLRADERQWTGSEPPPLPGHLEPRVATPPIEGPVALDPDRLSSDSRRLALGPLPPAPRPPGLLPDLGPAPYRGRLPTRDEITDHFASRPPGLVSPMRTRGALQNTATTSLAPRVVTPETLRPLTTASQTAQTSDPPPTALAPLRLLTRHRAPVAFGVVALLSSVFGMAAVWSLNRPGPSAARPPAASVATEANVTAPQPTPAADVVVNPLQLPTAPDGLFAVRPPHSALPCDAALGRPFVAESKPSPGRSSALWSQSRRSLLANREQLALTQMCQSAGWDLAGRAAYGLVEYYYQASDFQQALQWAERIPTRSPRYLDARGMIGDIYNQRGDLEAALSVYADTWNFQPQDKARRAEVAEGFLGGAVYALEHGDAWSAERYARRAIVLNPANSRAALTLANAFARFDLREASLGWAERARELER